MEFFTDMLDAQRLAAAVRHPHARRQRQPWPHTRDDSDGEGDAATGSDDDVAADAEADTGDDARDAHRTRTTRHERFARLNARVAEVLEDFNLVAFAPTAVTDAHTLLAALRMVDKSNGFVAPTASASAAADFLQAHYAPEDDDARMTVLERYSRKLQATTGDGGDADSDSD